MILKKLWYKLQWLWYKRNMPKTIIRKCRDKECRHKCGGIYTLEISIMRILDGYPVTVKYMCKDRWVSAMKDKFTWSVKSAAQRCCKENKLDVEV